MSSTPQEYNEIRQRCRDLFEKKMQDYGAAWRILRLPSLTDQIFIKAQRIRGLQERKSQRIAEGQESEFIGVINYALMVLVQLEKGVADQPDLSPKEALDHYDKQFDIAYALMEAKNHGGQNYLKNFFEKNESTYLSQKK